jgi:hypothetical protein
MGVAVPYSATISANQRLTYCGVWLRRCIAKHESVETIPAVKREIHRRPKYQRETWPVPPLFLRCSRVHTASSIQSPRAGFTWDSQARIAASSLLMLRCSNSRRSN